MDYFSYCDISSVFLTKTIDKMISPMAVHLCHMVISMECDAVNYTKINGDSEMMAEELAKAAEHFARTSMRLAAEYDDGNLKKEIETAAQALLLFGRNFLLSVQKLIIQPTIRKNQEELVVAAQNILTGTLKLLQLDDAADVRKIHQAADWLLECLKYLQKAEKMSHLLSHFYEFSEALLLVNSLTERRILDLKDSLHQQHLSQTLQILRKCVPMLHTATQSSIKHPYNEQMIASKFYIFDLATKTLQDLKCLLSIGPVKKERHQGSFSEDLNHLLEVLTNPKPSELNNSDLDYLVGAIIFYSMYVADCSRPNLKLRLIKHCQHLLEHRKRLCEHLKKLQESSCFYQLQQECVAMKEEIYFLRITLVSTMFYQILDAFAVKDPLKRLLKAALKNNKKASLHPQHLFASKSFQPYLQAFQDHTDHLLKVSSLVLAQSSQEQNIGEIQSSADCLCRVKEEVIALVMDTNKAYYESKMFEKAQYIYQKWIQATENLLMSFDGMLTVHQFVELSFREIEENRYHCEKLLRRQEVDLFQHHAADLCNLVERMAQVVNRHVDRSKDPIFRNGLRVLVRQLENSLLDIRTGMIKCVESISCSTTQKLFLEKVNYLFDCISNVQEGVSGCKHPDLLSPLRTEAGPSITKSITIDLNDFEETKDNRGKNHEDHNKSLLYEGYLSKPLPLLTSTKESIRNWTHLEKAIQVTDLQPLVADLLIAIRKQNPKDVHAYSSFLIEISRMYLQLVKDSIPHGAVTENDVFSFKDTEDLIMKLLHFSKQGNMDSILGVGKIIQTAILLSHRVKEIKTFLVSQSNYWYRFSFHLFCTSTNDVTTSTHMFNTNMQHLAEIVQSISEHLHGGHNVVEFPELSDKQEYLIKIHVMFSKCQAAANQLLTKVLCHGMKSDKPKLEDFCIFWSFATQQLSESIDYIIGINHLFMSESMDLTELNISENKSLVILCEASLWLQEAATISINNFTVEKELEKVGILKEEVGSLSEAVLKVRDNLDVSSAPALFLVVECGLLQKELMLKAKLLMYHMKNLYRGNQTPITRVVNAVISVSNSNNRSVIIGSFEKDVKLLIENVNYVKETLKKCISFPEKENVDFLVDHLFFLTHDIVAKARLLLEIWHQWDIFMLEAMYINWSAKADQLISHLQSNAEMDVTMVSVIKQCLTMGERTEFAITENPDSLKNITSNTSMQPLNITVKETAAAKENEQQSLTNREHDAANKHRNSNVYKPAASYSNEYSGIDGGAKVSTENNLTSKGLSTIEKKQRKTLNNIHKETINKSIKLVSLNQETGTNNCQQTESDNQNTNVDCQLKRNATIRKPAKLKMYVSTSGLQKGINYKKSDALIVNREEINIKLNSVLTEVQPERANLETKDQKTFTVLPGLHQESANQQNKDHDTHTAQSALHLETGSYEKTKDQETHRVLTEVHLETANLENPQQKKHTILTGLHKETANLKALNHQKSKVLTVVKNQINPQEAKSNYSTLHMEHTDIQKEKFSQGFKYHKIPTESATVKKERSILESRRIENGRSNQPIKDQQTYSGPKYMPKHRGQTEIANQKSTNKKTHIVMTKAAKETSSKESNISAFGHIIKCSLTNATCGEMQLESPGQLETDKLDVTNRKIAMTSSRGEKEVNIKQQISVNQKMQTNIYTEQQETETQDKQMDPFTLQEPPQGACKEQKHTSFAPQAATTLNSVKMDKKPITVSTGLPTNTTVMVEHQKVNCPSLEDVCWQPHRVAKCLLAEEVETWEGETNTIVKITREMAAQMTYMIQYLNRTGPIQTPEQFIASAKCIAALGQTFVKFIGIMAKNCTDTRNTSGLLCGMEQIQMISNQLNIISSVKTATGCGDYSAEEVLLKNAQNLIHSVLQTWKAAEAACIKAAHNPAYSEEEAEVAAFCCQLRKKLLCQRAKEIAD